MLEQVAAGDWAEAGTCPQTVFAQGFLFDLCNMREYGKEPSKEERQVTFKGWK